MTDLDTSFYITCMILYWVVIMEKQGKRYMGEPRKSRRRDTTARVGLQDNLAFAIS